MFQDLFSDSSTTARCTRVAPNFHDRKTFPMIVNFLIWIMDSKIIGEVDHEMKIHRDKIDKSVSTVTGGGCDRRRARAGRRGWLENLRTSKKL
jgi:hypothetical protein